MGENNGGVPLGMTAKDGGRKGRFREEDFLRHGFGEICLSPEGGRGGRQASPLGYPSGQKWRETEGSGKGGQGEGRARGEGGKGRGRVEEGKGHGGMALAWPGPRHGLTFLPLALPQEFGPEQNSNPGPADEGGAGAGKEVQGACPAHALHMHACRRGCRHEQKQKRSALGLHGESPTPLLSELYAA